MSRHPSISKYNHYGREFGGFTGIPVRFINNNEISTTKITHSPKMSLNSSIPTQLQTNITVQNESNRTPLFNNKKLNFITPKNQYPSTINFSNISS